MTTPQSGTSPLSHEEAWILRENNGFEVRKAGGTQYVYIGGAERLVAIGAELGIEDEWLAKAAERLQAG